MTEPRTQAGRDLLDGWRPAPRPAVISQESLRNAILAIEAEAIKPYREALAELLRYGEHEGPCDNIDMLDEACQSHVAASKRRDASATALLAEDSDAT